LLEGARVPTHRLIILGLLVAFVLVMAVDYWRKRKPKPKA
jgi:hypothetical protein